jgi:hypothetical protein
LDQFLGRNNEDIVLNCYRLARYYHIDPRTFLNMPLSEVQMHLNCTLRLEQIRSNAASSLEDED